MGAEQSQKLGQPSENYEDLLLKNTIVKKVNDPQYGECTILRDKTSGKQAILREINTTGEEEFKKSYAKYAQKQSLQHTNVIQLQKCIQKTESQFCSTFYKIYLVFEFVENSLQIEINKRIELSQQFSEEELWNILTQTINGLSYLYQNKVSHQNIKPSTIYITNDGLVKVIDPQLFQQIPMYQDILSNHSKSQLHNYLAPELLKSLKQQEWSPNHNQQKSDLFSLGMCVLHAANLQSLDDCYDYKDFVIKQDQLNQHLAKVKPAYGNNLYSFLQIMLNMNPQERQDIIFLDSILNQPSSQASSTQQPSLQQQTPQQSVITQSYGQPAQQQFNPYQQQKPLQQQPQQQYVKQEFQQAPLQNEDVKRTTKQQPQNQPNQQYFQQPISQTNQQQQFQVQSQGLSKPKTAPSMMKDSEDVGSTIKFIPQDNTQKIAKPDDNIGNALGGDNQESQMDDDNHMDHHKQMQNNYQNSYQNSVQQQHVDSNYGYSQQLNQINYGNPPVSNFNPAVGQNYISQSNSYSNNNNNNFQYTISTDIQQNNIKPISSGIQNSYGINDNFQYIPGPNSQVANNQSNVLGQSNYAIKKEEVDELVKRALNPNINNVNINSKPISEPQGAYKPSEEIEEILKKFRQQPQVQQEVQYKPNTIDYQHQDYKIQHQPISQQQDYFQKPLYQQQDLNQQFIQKPAFGTFELTKDSSKDIYNQFQHQKEYVIENYQNNSRYEGEKLNGLRHGRGKFFYQDGGLYDGEWKENKMHGKGVLSYASGKPAYDGDWVDDKFEGFGILYNENPAVLQASFDYTNFDNVDEYWTKYDGQFKDDNKEGFGTLYLSNGEKFTGTFQKDFVNGPGTFFCLNRQPVNGVWVTNKLQI